MSNFVMDKLFYTPISVGNLKDEELYAVQNEMDMAMRNIEFCDITEKWGRTHKVSHIDKSRPSFSEDVIELCKLNNFARILDNRIKEYCSELNLYYGSYYRSSWFTLFEEHDYAWVHNHGTADISGAYYYRTTGNEGSIFFKPPAPSMMTAGLFGELGKRISYPAEVGKMIMFPGWLEHGVETNTTKRKRISLSYNIYFQTLVK